MASKDAEILALNERLKVYEDAEKLAKESALEDIKNKATTLVEKAIEDKKIELTEKDSLISLAISNYATVENMFAKINLVKNNANPVFDFKNTKPDGTVEDRSKWSFNDWSKNDNKGLVDMQNKFPDQFNELVKKLKVTL